MTDVFISYAREDKDFVKQLHDALGRIDRDTWVDWEGIPPTAEWLEEIYSAIDQADTFLFIISPDSIGSQVCAQEIDHAVKEHKRLVPIVRRDTDDGRVPDTLAKLNWIFFREHDDFQSAFRTLVEAIDSDLDWIKAHTRFLVRAKEWERNHRESSLLLRGRDLQDAEEWLVIGVEKDPRPTVLQTQFVDASRKTQTKRQRITLSAVTVGFIVAVGAAIFAFYQREVAEERRKIAESRQLAAEALNNRADNLDVALLLAAGAYDSYQTLEAKNALLTVLGHSPHLSKFLFRNSNSIVRAAFSPSGKILAGVTCGERDEKGKCVRGEVRFWNVIDQKPSDPPITHSAAIFDVAFNPEERILVTANEDKSLTLWDFESRKPLGLPIAGLSENVKSVAFSPDGKTLVTGGWGGSVARFDVDSRKPIAPSVKPHSSRLPIWQVAYSPDGKLTATASVDGSIWLQDWSSSRRFSPMAAHRDKARSVAFSPDGNILASSGLDAKILLWDVHKRIKLQTPLIGHREDVTSVAFNPDGTILASSSTDGTLRLWDIAKRRMLGWPLTGHADQIWTMDFSSDGKTLASGSRDGSILLWNLEKLHPIETPLDTNIQGNRHLMFAPKGGLLAVSGCRELVTKTGRLPTCARGAIQLWDIESRRPSQPPLRGHEGRIISIAFSPEGNRFASVSCGHSEKPQSRCKEWIALLWDVISRKQLGRIKLEQADWSSRIVFGRDGSFIAISRCAKRGAQSGCERSEIGFWDIETLQPARPNLAIFGNRVLEFGFEAKNRLSAVVGSKSGPMAISYDLEQGEPLSTELGELSRARSVAFDSNSRILAAVGCGESARGTGCTDDEIHLFDLTDRRPVGRPITGLPGSTIATLALAPDGKTLAAAGCTDTAPGIGCTGGTIRLYDVESGRPIGRPLTGIRKRVTDLAFSPDGTTLASVSDGERLMLWDMDPREWQRRACEIAAPIVDAERRPVQVGTGESRDSACPRTGDAR